MKKSSYLTLLTKLSSQIIQEKDSLHEKGLFSNEKKEIIYTVKESYIINLLISLGEVETILEQLNHSSLYISNFRSTNKLKLNGITRFHHITYHIESFLFRTTGILDRLLIHINILLGLKMNAIDCKPSIMIRTKKGDKPKIASHIENEDGVLYAMLVDLLKIINKFRDPRNLITHQERYSSERLKRAELFTIVLHDGENVTNKDMYAHAIKQELDKAVGIYKKEMAEFTQSVSVALDNIYQRLEALFIRISEKK